MDRVDLIAPNLSGKGGTETVLSIVLSNEYILKEFNFELILLDRLEDDRWLNEISKKVSLKKRERGSRLSWMIKNFVRSNADIIIVLGPRLALIAKIIKIIFRKKYKIVTWIHFSLFSQNIMNVQYVKFADYHLAISSQMVAQFERLGVKKENVYVIYNPVKKLEKLPEYSKKIGEIHIAYVGRIMLDGQKNLRLLIDSLEKLSLESSSVVFLDFWGGGQITEVKNYIERENSRGNLKIEWHGWDNNPWEKINNIDLLVLTSKFEGFGMALTEAISRGIPVVATDYPVGARDIIVSGVNGELADYSANSVKSAIVKVLNYSGDREETIRNTMDKFTVEKYSERFVNALKKILRG